MAKDIDMDDETLVSIMRRFFMKPKGAPDTELADKKTITKISNTITDLDNTLDQIRASTFNVRNIQNASNIRRIEARRENDIERKTFAASCRPVDLLGTIRLVEMAIKKVDTSGGGSGSSGGGGISGNELALDADLALSVGSKWIPRLVKGTKILTGAGLAGLGLEMGGNIIGGKTGAAAKILGEGVSYAGMGAAGAAILTAPAAEAGGLGPLIGGAGGFVVGTGIGLYEYGGDLFGDEEEPQGARAMGGPVMANRPYLVGENGPEIFTPDTFGQIIPLKNHSGPIIYKININNITESQETRNNTERYFNNMLEGNAKVASGQTLEAQRAAAPVAEPPKPASIFESIFNSIKNFFGGMFSSKKEGGDSGGAGAQCSYDGTSVGYDPSLAGQVGSSTQQAMRVLYNTFKNGGMTHEGAIAMLAHVGRETDYGIPMYTSNGDPLRSWNTGIAQWSNTTTRNANLKKFLQQKGIKLSKQTRAYGYNKLVGPDFWEMERTDAALRAQAEFIIQEMRGMPVVWAAVTEPGRPYGGQLDKNGIEFIIGKHFENWAMTLPVVGPRGFAALRDYQAKARAVIGESAMPAVTGWASMSGAPNIAGNAFAISTNVANTNRVYVVGDSIAAGIATIAGGNVISYVHGGKGPAHILDAHILGKTRCDTREYRGKHGAARYLTSSYKPFGIIPQEGQNLRGALVILSSGAANQSIVILPNGRKVPADYSQIPLQIAALKNAGVGRIVLLGVYSQITPVLETGNRVDYRGANELLAKIAREGGVDFTGPLENYGRAQADGVHPREAGLRAIYNACLSGRYPGGRAAPLPTPLQPRTSTAGADIARYSAANSYSGILNPRAVAAAEQAVAQLAKNSGRTSTAADRNNRVSQLLGVNAPRSTPRGRPSGGTNQGEKYRNALAP